MKEAPNLKLRKELSITGKATQKQKKHCYSKIRKAL
jgi:hypothetical protein